MSLIVKKLSKTGIALTLGLGLFVATDSVMSNTTLNQNIEAQASTKTYYVKSTTYLRASNSTKSKAIVKVKKGTTLKGLKSKSANWYKLTYGGKTRYILKSKITVKSTKKETATITKKVSTESSSGNLTYKSIYNHITTYSEKYPKTYDALEKAVLNGDSSTNVKMSEFKNNDYSKYLSEILMEIDYNNPTKVVDRYSHYPTISYYKYWSTGKVELTYTLSKKTRDNYVKKSSNKIASVAKTLAKPSDSDYKKVKAVNDYVKKSMTYDYAWQKGNEDIISHTVYGGIVNNFGVCDAYSKTVEALLNYLGVESGAIQGTNAGVAHSWNYVNIDGEYYYLDATFDDTGETTDYFLINTKQMSKDHTWDKTSYPVATSSKYM